MSNLAAALKEEICRLARKEIKFQVDSTRQAVTQHRRDIAALKRQVQEQKKKIAFLEAQERKRVAEFQRRCRECPLLIPICQSPARSPENLSEGLRTLSWRVGSNDLQLGAGQVTPETSTIGRTCRFARDR